MNLLESIKTELLKIKDIQSCLIYPNSRTEVVAPAVFLEIASYQAGDDPATGELSLVANVEARVVVDSLIENANIVCQSLAYEVANVAHLNSFGCEVSPAKVSGITRDYFKPDFDPYVCWLVEWTHEFHVGENVWKESGISPHIININNEVVNE